LPQAIRVDNGAPWGTSSDVPSALALWLVGLGVNVIYNRPHHSTDNGLVERAHGVLSNWVEAWRCLSMEAAQNQLTCAVKLQRDGYASRGGLLRAQRYPALYRNPRPYREEQERQQWSYDRVALWLAQRVFVRRVDRIGRISLFSQAYTVGRTYHGRDVTVRFDADQQQWCIADEQGTVLRRYLPKDVTEENIRHFNLTKRHDNPNSLS
jgi:hypothetical protein